MRNSLRQSMAWLHTWAGLLVGWILFFVFLTGTFGYLVGEIQRWMTPERPLYSSPPAASTLLPVARDWLAQEKGDSRSWYITLPGRQNAGELTVVWRTWPEDGTGSGSIGQQLLDPMTGRPVDAAFRETGGGSALYRMHYELHYMPRDWAILIVGVCSMFMLVAIFSGVIVHRKIFTDFFTFRPGRGQRSWLDGHNLLSVPALPFHLMITWSGLILFLFTYMPLARDSLYPEGLERDKFYTEVSSSSQISLGTPAPPEGQAPLEPMLAEAQRRWGEGNTIYFRIESPGLENSRVLVSSVDTTVRRGKPGLLFDGVSGKLLNERLKSGPPVDRFEQTMIGLHEGHFAGPLLRTLYVFAGLVGTAMIGTGLLLWSSKRKAKVGASRWPQFGMVAVDVLNLGTIIGLPIGIAAYFWSNRLLPVSMEGRAAWEVHSMFITWSLIYVYAIWRRLDRAWFELCALAGAVCGLIPILNALTTDRDLITSISQNDWVFAGFDLSALAASMFFAWLAWMVRRRQLKRTEASSDGMAVVSELETA